MPTYETVCWRAGVAKAMSCIVEPLEAQRAESTTLRASLRRPSDCVAPSVRSRHHSFGRGAVMRLWRRRGCSVRQWRLLFW